MLDAKLQDEIHIILTCADCGVLYYNTRESRFCIVIALLNAANGLLSVAAEREESLLEKDEAVMKPLSLLFYRVAPAGYSLTIQLRFFVF